MSRFDVRSSDVRLTWNLTGNLLESFWDDPQALSLKPWSRGASPLRGLIWQFQGWWRIKRCRFDLKLDVEPFGCILRPSLGSDQRFCVSDVVAASSFFSAVGEAKLGQMILKWPETSCVLLFWASWEILQFLFDSDKIRFFGCCIARFGRLRLHVAFFCCWRGKVTFLVSTNAPSRYSDELLNFCSRCASKRTLKENFWFWPRVFWAVFLLVLWPFELPREFYGSEGIHAPSRGKVLKNDIWDVSLDFCFLTLWPNKLYVAG